jgi:hypothetical protein
VISPGCGYGLVDDDELELELLCEELDELLLDEELEELELLEEELDELSLEELLLEELSLEELLSLELEDVSPELELVSPLESEEESLLPLLEANGLKVI